MLGKNNPQIDVFTHMIFDRLIPEDHLLVLINSIIDFSFVYDIVKEKYSDIGRKSEDPVMMLKICLLEFLYTLSDKKVVKRIQTDIAFRWFLGLSLDDEVPDDTTISHFRTNRMGEESFDEFFNEIVRNCIEKNIVKSKRYLIDTTDVAANVNYPSNRRLICDAFRKVIRETRKFNELLAEQLLVQFENEIEEEYKIDDKVSVKEYLQIAQKYAEYLYLKTYDELQTNEKYQEVFGILWDIIDQYTNGKKDKIVSVVDPDAKIAHKSLGNIKRGYKDHIIVDEDSEIILASVQTPFNVGDEKKLAELIEKVEESLGLKPEEITADKVYGTTGNRAYLKDNEIISNIAFYEESSREVKYYGLRDFKISEDLKSVTCPNGIITEEYVITRNKTNDTDFKVFKFDKAICQQCPLRDQCLYKDKNGKVVSKGRRLDVPLRYDAVLRDMKRVATKEFEEASNKRFKVERRFATMVRNHGLRRCRYVRLGRAKIHITLANMACNIIRMVNLLCQPEFAASPN
ncbi:MAG TPA: IS1182 family transposase [Bacillota bacterium]|nr:IS1182 family transposase [Bacillota bacterium]HQO42558.1 IS1182 family transposase [Bacillota bacterium]HQQ43632.1 IS1182 family transposase [Bacillota bacterium]